MTTAKQIRDVVISCAEDALKEVPDGVNFRARTFAAFLTGALAACEEDRMVSALRKLLAPDGATPPGDRAGAR
jgi:hypothetical protein